MADELIAVSLICLSLGGMLGVAVVAAMRAATDFDRRHRLR